jgi:hypothetical protein
MQVWSQHELAVVGPEKAEWEDMFTLFGGVPRMMLCGAERKPDLRRYLEDMIKSANRRFVLQFTSDGSSAPLMSPSTIYCSTLTQLKETVANMTTIQLLHHLRRGRCARGHC